MPIIGWNENWQRMALVPGSYRYRSKWVCFSCKKTMVKTVDDPARTILCPVCRAPAVDMGYLFQPPPKRNKRLWDIARILAGHGWKYHRVKSKVFIDFYLTDHDRASPNLVRRNIEAVRRCALRCR